MPRGRSEGVRGLVHRLSYAGSRGPRGCEQIRLCSGGSVETDSPRPSLGCARKEPRGVTLPDASEFYYERFGYFIFNGARPEADCTT